MNWSKTRCLVISQNYHNRAAHWIVWYDQIKSGKVQPIDGEDAFTRLRN
jgi:hypothetical protein